MPWPVDVGQLKEAERAGQSQQEGQVLGAGLSSVQLYFSRCLQLCWDCGREIFSACSWCSWLINSGLLWSVGSSWVPAWFCVGGQGGKEKERKSDEAEL